MESISQRIKHLIDLKNHNISSFEKEIGVGNNSIGTLLKRNSNPSGEILSKILNTYEEVNANWLISGKGNMFLDENSNNSNKEEISKLIRIIATLEKHTSLQQKVIETQEAFIRNLDKEVAPVYEQLKNLNERLEKVEDFKEAIKLLTKLNVDIEKKEQELKSKKSVNRKS